MGWDLSKLLMKLKVWHRSSRQWRCVLRAKFYRYGCALLGSACKGFTGGHYPRYKSGHIEKRGGIAFQSMDVMNAMESDTGITITGPELIGASVNNLLMQIQAM